MTISTHLYVSKKTYQFLVITSLRSPSPVKIDEDLDHPTKGHFLRLPVSTLGVAIWGFDNPDTASEFCSKYGLHEERISP